MTITSDTAAVRVELTVDGAAPLSAALLAEVTACCDRIERAEQATAAIITLSGSPAAPRAAGTALVNKWERALRRLERLRVPVLAVAHGDCGGVALEALLTADYRLATPDLRLLPAGHGAGPVWPGMALYRLANQLDAARLRAVALFGASLSATDALAGGIVDELVADVPAALAAAQRLAARSDRGLPVRRQLLQEATTTTFEDALGRHLAACDRALREP